MKQELRERLQQMAAEEQKAPIDRAMLEQLRALMRGDGLGLVQNLLPAERNALNHFLRDIRDFMVAEMMRGDYGSSVIADSTVVMAFEAGFAAATHPELSKKLRGPG